MASRPEDSSELDVVDALKREHDALRGYLQEAEPSLASSAESSFAKTLVLAGASYLEHSVQQCIIALYRDVAPEEGPVVQFVSNKAIARQYHTFFEWNAGNANSFFAMFGGKLRTAVKELVQKEPDLDTSIRAFLELGGVRNQLVHQNYAAFTLEKTGDEVYALFTEARKFVVRLPELLRLGSSAGNSE